MRNEDYDRELLAGVTRHLHGLGAASSPRSKRQSRPSAKAVAQTPTRVEQLEPVRVVGTPLVLNTNPSVRLAKD